jgi:F-type H+-transporting ATPase subunit c
MSRSTSCRRAIAATLLTLAVAAFVGSPILYAQEPGPGGAGIPVLHLLGVAVGLGMIVIGAGVGIGKLAAAAAEGIARQPNAAAQITGAVNLPLFLLEGVAILAEVFALLVLLLANPFTA